ncbi:hypothetical protein HC928_21525 [bacterium]|nr:hypothetical protein [bacterium]
MLDPSGKSRNHRRASMIVIGAYGRGDRVLDPFPFVLIKPLLSMPEARKPVNPRMALALELLGYIGLLGIGRMYAGNWSDGITTMVLWFASVVYALLALLAATLIIGFFALLHAALGFIVFMIYFLLYGLPFLIVPLRSALALYEQLKEL